MPTPRNPKPKPKQNQIDLPSNTEYVIQQRRNLSIIDRHPFLLKLIKKKKQGIKVSYATNSLSIPHPGASELSGPGPCTAAEVHTSPRAAQPAGMTAAASFLQAAGREKAWFSSRYARAFRDSRTGKTWHASTTWNRSRGIRVSHLRSERTREGRHREKRPWAPGPRKRVQNGAHQMEEWWVQTACGTSERGAEQG
jgi:hypothetical protein